MLFGAGFLIVELRGLEPLTDVADGEGGQRQPRDVARLPVEHLLDEQRHQGEAQAEQRPAGGEIR